ncbi:glycosyltransferase family A protein [Cyclobacterium sp. 1_MG-2023]|uniref:glycosyltransferase family 2 protein n=1 Tax=Cyclobacterium sp. 1_MG-2023 TaxID=3062681 RepID=UPI0026E403E3|nr:glycosyltransferase family A protein [Cyclobacterium sp. 1_MG-2023]MDO6436228.1 glycosyltransferase family A protein [Cyclobacterium sp. 1_MG-2023]
MKEDNAYIVSHLFLENLAIPNLTDTCNQGVYLTVWWKEIPLGHFELAPNTSFSANDFYQKVVWSIEATLEFYLKNQNTLLKDDWKKMILEGRGNDLRVFLEKVFFSITHVEFPKVVPISIIICTRNRAKDLKRCLDSIMRMASLPAELIVIDNAPNDDQTKELVNDYGNVKYYEETKPGLSNARNKGVVESSQTIISFTDDDVEVHKDWAFRIWEAFENNKKLYAITGLVLPKELNSPAQVLFEKSWSFNRGYINTEYGAIYWRKNLSKGPPVWQLGAGANMAFRKEVFNTIGYFDEKLGAGASGCSEDSEVWFRILNNHNYMEYCPLAVVFHKHRYQLSELKSQIFQYMKGHVVAALVQQTQNNNAGYRKYVYVTLPKYYLNKIVKIWKGKGRNFKFLRNEITGVLAGVFFYYKNYKH